MNNKSLFILLRHGHRAPGHVLEPAISIGANAVQLTGISHRILNDTEKWSLQSFVDTNQEYLNNQAKRFAVISADDNPTPSDERGFPFGFITNKGASFMTQLGRHIYDTYSSILNHILTSSEQNTYSTATNYRRTQISTQFFLEGLIPRNSTQPFQIACLPVEWCPMTFYESYPKVAVPLVRKTVQSERYRAAESILAVQQAMAAMLKEFPIIANNKYGFNWPLAHDYFACHRGHNLSILDHLKEHEEAIYKQFIFRYYSYYSHDPQHRAMTAGPILNAMLSSFNTSTPRLTVFGGHDINIFAILCALNLTLDPWTVEGDAHDQLPPLWPPFGSSLVIQQLDEHRLHLRYLYHQARENTSPKTTNRGNWDRVSSTEAEVTLDVEKLEDLLAELRSEARRVKEEYNIHDQRW